MDEDGLAEVLQQLDTKGSISPDEEEEEEDEEEAAVQEGEARKASRQERRRRRNERARKFFTEFSSLSLSRRRLDARAQAEHFKTGAAAIAQIP